MKLHVKKFLRRVAGSRDAFTLMEVNLAILIMAIGVLVMTSLYPFGFRESEAAHDDVRAAVVADEVLGKLSAALSSRNITWDDWVENCRNAVEESNKGGQGNAWYSYFDNDSRIKSRSSVNSHAKTVFSALAAACSGATEVPNWNPDSKYAQGLVVQWGKRVAATGKDRFDTENDYSRVSISFRMAKRPGALIGAPVYYTEVHFQGDQKEMEQ